MFFYVTINVSVIKTSIIVKGVYMPSMQSQNLSPVSSQAGEVKT